MGCFSLYLLIIILYKSDFCDTSKACPSELDDTGRVQWSSMGTTDKELVFSTPLCVSENSTIVTRLCMNGIWLPSAPPNCTRVIKQNKKCPQYLYERNDCIFIDSERKPGAWCHLSLTKDLLVSNIEDFIQRSIINLPITSKVLFGPAMYFSWDEAYGTIYRKLSRDDDNYKGYTYRNPYLMCIYVDTVNEYTYANQCYYFPGICLASHSAEFELCPKNCISAGLGTQSCYCKEKSTGCLNTATIRSPYERRILGQLAGEEVCRIGNSNINTSLKLSDHQEVITNDFWGFTKAATSDCTICKVPSITNITVDLLLTFEPAVRKLYLIAYSPEGIRRYKTSDGVFCFVDGTRDIVEKLSVKKLFEFRPSTSKERAYNVYELEVLDYLRTYWCEVHVIKNRTEIQRSNEVLAYKRKIGQEYSLSLGLFFREIHQGKAPLFRYVNKTIFHNLNSSIRIKNVISVNSYRRVIVIYHVSTNLKTRNVTAEYDNIILNLKFNLPGLTPRFYFDNREYCLEEYTDGYHWPLTKFGDVVYPKEQCNRTMCKVLPERECYVTYMRGHAYGFWGPLKKTNVFVYPTKVKKFLLNLKSKVTFSVLENLTNIIKTQSELMVNDLYYFPKLLRSIRKPTVTILNKSIEFVNALENSSHIPRNSTILPITYNKLLTTFNDMLTEVKTENATYSYSTENIVIYKFKPFISNISGVAVYNNKNNFEFITIPRNQTFTTLTYSDNLLIAIYLPEGILEQISQNYKNHFQVEITTTIFLKKNIFSKTTFGPVGPILSVSTSIPGYGLLREPLQVLFSSKCNLKGLQCVFWDYGRNTGEIHYGKWSRLGSNYLGTFRDEFNLYMCSYSHLAHFALLGVDQETLPLLITKKNSEFSRVIASQYLEEYFGKYLSGTYPDEDEDNGQNIDESKHNSTTEQSKQKYDNSPRENEDYSSTTEEHFSILDSEINNNNEYFKTETQNESSDPHDDSSSQQEKHNSFSLEKEFYNTDIETVINDDIIRKLRERKTAVPKNIPNLLFKKFRSSRIENSILQKMKEDVASESSEVIDFISFSMDILTIFGVGVIFFTATILQKWRKQQGTIILLHISMVILMESMVINLVFHYTSNSNTVLEKTLKYYLLLSKYSWILVYAYLQYFRYVKVLGAIPNNLVLKSTIFGWCFGVVPTILFYIFANPCGIKASYMLKALSLIFTLLGINLVIFCVILYKIFVKKVELQKNKTNLVRKFLVSVLLFFVLGLSYLIAMVSGIVIKEFSSSAAFYTLNFFMIFAKLDGFILFLFYVVLNNEIRQLLFEYFKKCKNS